LSSLSFGLDPHGQSLLAFFLLIAPAGLYIMGLFEDKRGHWLMGAGLLVHAFSILQRWGYTGLIPLSEKRDNISLTAFIMAAVLLYLRIRRKPRDLSLFILPIITSLVFIAIGHRTMDSITPFMETPWFYLHVLFYFSSYAFFGLGAASALQYLIKQEPAQETLSYRLASTGWVLLTVSLLFGSTWFYLAYGTYWLWTSKELWITMTWLSFGLYLHARMTRGLSGGWAAAFCVSAYAIALFTYFGVGTLIKAPPTQF
jgi:ABC-type transport system involved in cytochrome c biogenesis permease subunit